MPKIINSKNELKTKLLEFILLITAFWLIAITIIIVLEVLDLLSYFGFFIIMIVTLMTPFMGRNVKVLMSGIQGENRATKDLSELPKDYTVFVNKKIYFEEKESETDLIIIGKNGVFIFEIKNHKGEIKGREEDKEWLQIKRTEKGGIYKNHFYSPVKQVNTHVYRVSGILKEKGYDGWIQSAVKFSNPESELKIGEMKTPVLNKDEKISEFIENFKPRKTLTKSEIKKIIKTIKTNKTATQ